MALLTPKQFGLQFAMLLAAFGSAWTLLALFNFGYGLWYDLLEIELFIAEVGPKNYYKQGFSLLDKQQYTALFAAINYAVHLAPHTLAEISYSIPLNANSTFTETLLRPPEVLHLQDVAKLLSFLKIATLIAWIVVIFNIKTNVTTSLKAMAITWVLIAILTGIVVAIKPVAVFYWLHDLIFPPENQWFFYYQESLMTTLMKAPAIFGPISISLLIITIGIHASLNLSLRRMQTFKTLNTVKKKPD